MNNIFYLISEVGFPIAGALVGGFFIFLTLKYILASVTGSVATIEGMIKDLVKVDTLMSHTLGVKPNIDRIAANEGKEDARRD